MIKINGKEYNLFYSIAAHVAFDSWVLKNPKATYVEGVIKQFCFMVSAYNDAHGIQDKAPKMEEFMNMPNSIFLQMAEAVEAQKTADSETTVEAEPVESKNAESAQASS